MEDELLRTVARMDGTPFPSTAKLVGRVLRGKVRQDAGAELAFCAEAVAEAYAAMGLIDPGRPANYYDPGQVLVGRRPRADEGRAARRRDPGAHAVAR